MISTILNPPPQRKRSRRGRVVVAIVVTIALGFVLPPTVNLKYFRTRLSESLSRSLGLQVSLEDVRLRLLPLPGFTFRHLKIGDDDEFGAEPIVQTAEDYADHSTATLRLTSLWQGRLEIASISLTQASLNLSRASDGHWNLERLINRAAQVPSAPTNKKKPETRARFPYIELKDSRINFKFGAEKKPFTLSDADVALWLPAENRWNVRLKAVPLRTDENISDTGTIRISGSFDRAAQFSQTPFHFQVNWERPEVNAIARIARGHDPGWRGAVDLIAELKGTPIDFSARTNASIDEFRRYDIARSSPMDVRISCDHRFRTQVPGTNTGDQLDFKCKLPLNSGSLTAQGELHPLGKSLDFSVRLFASEVPLSGLVSALVRAKSTLPDDLTAEGVVNGGWSIESRQGAPVKWEGALSASHAVLHSRVLEEPLTFPRLVTMNFETPAPPFEGASRKGSARNFRSGHAVTRAGSIGQTAASQAVVQPFTIDLGGEVEISALFDTEGYRISANGPVHWERLLQIAHAIGLHPPATDLKGSGILNAQYAGQWHHFAPPTVSGQAQIRSAVLSLRGFQEPLRVNDGTLKFDAAEFRAERLSGSFSKSGLEFLIDFAGSRQCERYVVCDLSFNLATDELSDTALMQLVGAPSSGLTLPFLNSGRQFEAKWLLDISSSGTVNTQRLVLRKFEATKLSAQLKVSGDKILVNNWSADMFGGRHSGDLAFDLSGADPSITANGTVQHSVLEELNTVLNDHVATGNLDVQYHLTMNGRTGDRLLASLKGSGQFVWHDGTVQATPANDSQDATLNFSAWSGRFAVERQRIALQSSKMISAAGVREVAGDISFDHQWNLRLSPASGSGLVATAGTPAPVVPKQPIKGETR